jgi:hypothetical protein
MKFGERYFQNYISKLQSNFSEIASAVKKSRENPYQIAGWINKENREKDVLIYRVTATDKYIDSHTLLEIYSDNAILLNFSKEEIKYISSLAVLLLYKQSPRYQVVWENFRNNIQEDMVKIKDRDKSSFIKTRISEIEKDISLIDKLPSRDAYRLGKEIGIRERILEEEIISKSD